jgi:predicted small secreted protein
MVWGNDPYTFIEDYDEPHPSSRPESFLSSTAKKEKAVKYLTQNIYNDNGKLVPQGTYLYPREHPRNTENKQYCMYRTGAEEGNPQQHTMFVPTAYIGERVETDNDSEWEA